MFLLSLLPIPASILDFLCPCILPHDCFPSMEPSFYPLALISSAFPDLTPCLLLIPLPNPCSHIRSKGHNLPSSFPMVQKQLTNYRHASSAIAMTTRLLSFSSSLPDSPSRNSYSLSATARTSYLSFVNSTPPRDTLMRFTRKTGMPSTSWPQRSVTVAVTSRSAILPAIFRL